MFNIKFEGNFSADEKFLTRRVCNKVAELSGLAVEAADGKHAAAVMTWFGAFDPTRLRQHVRMLHEAIHDSNRTVTFVDARGKGLRVEYKSIYQAPEHQANSSPTDSAFAWVFPISAGERQPDGMYVRHVGSGMRLYLAQQYFNCAEFDWNRPQTIYHELSHKIIGTNDHVYEAEPCRRLAATEPRKAGTNADNYGFLLTTLGGYDWFRKLWTGYPGIRGSSGW